MAGLFLLLALILAGGFCAWVYYRREFEVRSRAFLLAARAVAVAGVVALLWNPVVPTGPRSDGPERYVVLDASASMGARSADGGRLWDSAVARVRALTDDGARILVAGAAPRTVDPDSLDGLAPTGVESVLAEAVTVAAEAGAREVVLVTDRRVRDPVATALASRRMGVRLAVEALAPAAENLGVGRLVLPATAASGEIVRGRVEVEGGAAGSDSVAVTVSVDGEPRHTLRLASPSQGRTSGADFSLGRLAPGTHAVTARLAPADAFALDDERTAVVQVDPEETGVLLVSFAPDWEPRFLLPVLDQITGLPVRGYLRTGPDRYHPMEAATADAAAAIDQAAVERLLRRAEMVVAMGVDGSNVDLVERVTARTRRLLLFPIDGAGAAAGGIATAAARSGEWYLDEAPPSPIAGEVEQFVGAGLPPLTRVLPVVGESAGAALHLRLGGGGGGGDRPRPARRGPPPRGCGPGPRVLALGLPGRRAARALSPPVGGRRWVDDGRRAPRRRTGSAPGRPGAAARPAHPLARGRV